MVRALLRSPKARVFLWNFWPPFWAAGIRIAEISDDVRHMRIEMRLRWFNKNYVGTHYGGSLYSMTDPFYMVMLLQNLGSQYVVWDKAAKIEFLKPGRGLVAVDFHLSESTLDKIRQQTATGEKYVFDIPVQVKDELGNIIAEVVKTLYVRKKAPKAKAV